MTWEELLLLLHIVAAIVWLGSGLFLQILATRLRQIDGSAAQSAPAVM